MPALATTMSRRPRSATACSTTAAHRGRVADVGLGGDHPAVECLDLLDGLGEIVGGRGGVFERVDRRAQIDGDDVGAFLGQADCVAAALTPGGTGDQGDLSFDTTHTHSYHRPGPPFDSCLTRV